MNRNDTWTEAEAPDRREAPAGANCSAARDELVAAALHYTEIQQDHTRSAYISTNGRHGRSPWAELCDAAKAFRHCR